MFARAVIVSMVVLSLAATIHSQTESPVEATLRPLDFGLVRVGVANPRQGAKSAASFIVVYGGFSIHSLAGCVVILRNEGMDRGRRFVYEVVIPLAELSSKGSIGEAVGEVGPPGSDMGQEFYPWSITYDVRSRSRRVVLHDRIRKRILARGAHVSFSVRERNVLDKIEEAFGKAIGICNQR
jgi:hypothetical protein